MQMLIHKVEKKNDLDDQIVLIGDWLTLHLYYSRRKEFTWSALT